VHWWRLAALVHAVAAVLGAALARITKEGGPGLPRPGRGLSLVLLCAKRKTDDPKEADVIRCMAPERIPVLATLAKGFAVCTRWHYSVPGETWPKQNFVHAATSEETVEIEAGFYKASTVFDVLERHGASWRVYHDGRAQLGLPETCGWGSAAGAGPPSATSRTTWPPAGWPPTRSSSPTTTARTRAASTPQQEAKDGGADFVRAERLMADVYGACAATEVFEKTLRCCSSPTTSTAASSTTSARGPRWTTGSTTTAASWPRSPGPSPPAPRPSPPRTGRRTRSSTWRRSRRPARWRTWPTSLGRAPAGRRGGGGHHHGSGGHRRGATRRFLAAVGGHRRPGRRRAACLRRAGPRRPRRRSRVEGRRAHRVTGGGGSSSGSRRLTPGVARRPATAWP
jgi:hypothetical protein